MRWNSIGLVLVMALTLPGCALFSSKHGPAAKAKPGTLFIVKAETAPFYKRGPQKSHKADRQLPKDTLLTVTRHAFGYSKVQLADGQEGFVANEDLVLASDTLLATASDGSSQTEESLPPPPDVALPTADSSPQMAPSATPDSLLPQ